MGKFLPGFALRKADNHKQARKTEKNPPAAGPSHETHWKLLIWEENRRRTFLEVKFVGNFKTFKKHWSVIINPVPGAKSFGFESSHHAYRTTFWLWETSLHLYGLASRTWSGNMSNESPRRFYSVEQLSNLKRVSVRWIHGQIVSVLSEVVLHRHSKPLGDFFTHIFLNVEQIFPLSAPLVLDNNNNYNIIASPI